MNLGEDILKILQLANWDFSFFYAWQAWYKNILSRFSNQYFWAKTKSSPSSVPATVFQKWVVFELLEVTRNTEKISPTHTKHYIETAQTSPLFWEDQVKYLTVCTNRWVPTAEYASPEGKDVGQCNLTFSLCDCNNIGLIIISQLLRGGLWNKVSHAQST